MAPQSFKDENVMIIAPGSHTTLAQFRLPESFTPAALRVKSRMFPGLKKGEFEPVKIRERSKREQNGASNEDAAGQQPTLEEDPTSDEGAVWPIRGGRIEDWDCFFALMRYVFDTLGAQYLYTSILLIAEPVWTPKDYERITQFFFETIRMPAFTIMDSAQASCYAFGLQTATVIDIGAEKADITAVVDFTTQEIGRRIAMPGFGGESMTQRLLDLLGSKGFSREMCKQLKQSPVCEVLPPGVALPTANAGASSANGAAPKVNPATAASTGADGPGASQRSNAGSAGNMPLGPGPDTQVGDGTKEDEDNEGVIDVAAIVAGGKMNEYLERKEKEKAEKLANRKPKGGDKDATGANAQPKPIRLRNAERVTNTFLYEDFAAVGAMKTANMSDESIRDATTAMEAGVPSAGSANTANDSLAPTSPTTTSPTQQKSSVRREISIGTERFRALPENYLIDLSTAIYRTITSVPYLEARAKLWDNLIVVGNGAAVRGFKEALAAHMSSRFLISPSSGTIFTSELPSNFTTPIATGANTPNPHAQPPSIASHPPHGVNPLLYAATTASSQQLGNTPAHLQQGAAGTPPHHPHAPPHMQPHVASHFVASHHSHSQSPTSIRLARLAEYFPEWKEHGHEEAAFLGAQVAAKVIFVVDGGTGNSSGPGGKGYMSRSDWNEQGPSGIFEYSI